MLSKEVFKTGMKKLMALYPMWKVECDDPDVMKIWHKEFINLTDEYFTNAISKYCRSEKFNPTVVGIMELVEKKGDSPLQIDDRTDVF